MALGLAAQYNYYDREGCRILYILPTSGLVEGIVYKFQKLSLQYVAPGYGKDKSVTTDEAFESGSVIVLLCPARFVEYCGYDCQTGNEKNMNESLMESRKNILKAINQNGAVIYDESHFLWNHFISCQILPTIVNFYLPNVQLIAMTATTITTAHIQPTLNLLNMPVSTKYNLNKF